MRSGGRHTGHGCLAFGSDVGRRGRAPRDTGRRLPEGARSPRDPTLQRPGVALPLGPCAELRPGHYRLMNSRELPARSTAAIATTISPILARALGPNVSHTSVHAVWTRVTANVRRCQMQVAGYRSSP